MKISKKYILPLVLFLFNSAFELIAQDKYFLKDTVIESSGLKIKFEYGYGKGDIAKIKMLVTNFTEDFVIINPSDVFIGAIRGPEVSSQYKKIIVVAPKEFIKVNLGFKGLQGMESSQVAVGIKKIGFSDSVLTSFDQLSILPVMGTRVEKQSLNLEVVEVNPRAKDYAVKLELKYTGSNFVNINYSKAIFVSELGEFSNVRKSKLFYNNFSSSQKMLMVFPCTKGRDIKISGSIKLDNVFKEYSIKTVNGFKVRLGNVSEEEFRKKKVEKEEVIEEID